MPEGLCLTDKHCVLGGAGCPEETAVNEKPAGSWHSSQESGLGEVFVMTWTNSAIRRVPSSEPSQRESKFGAGWGR